MKVNYIEKQLSRNPSQFKRKGKETCKERLSIIRWMLSIIAKGTFIEENMVLNRYIVIQLRHKVNYTGTNELEIDELSQKILRGMEEASRKLVEESAANRWLNK